MCVLILLLRNQSIKDMPYKEKETEKLYWTIGEVAKMFGVNTSLIRFWEKEFDIIKPHKNKKGNRLFTKGDIDKFKEIFHLVKDRGYTLDGARKELKASGKNKPEATETIAPVVDNTEAIAKLQAIREQLVELKDKL